MSDGTGVWIAPGGGVDGDESFEQAALRELWEEVGLVGVPLGPCVWHRSHVFAYGDQLIEQQERFFVCRIDAHEIGDHVNLDERERAEITAYRWWTLDEIEASRDRFGPRDLAVLLRPIIEGRLPTDPIAVGI